MFPPPAKALAGVGNAARVGPGPVKEVADKNGYHLELAVKPNQAAVPNTFAVRLTRGGTPAPSQASGALSINSSRIATAQRGRGCPICFVISASLK